MGRAMTLALVQTGARVAMLDINEEWLEQSANEVRAVGGDDCVLALVCDVSDPESVEEAVRKTITGLGGTARPDQQRGGQLTLRISPAANSPSSGTSPRRRGAELSPSIPADRFFMARAVVGHMPRPGMGPDHRRHDQRQHHVPAGTVPVRTIQGKPRGTGRANVP